MSPQNLLTRLTPEMLTGFYEVGFWTDRTIYSLAREHSELNGSRRAVRDSNCTLSYAELVDTADRIAVDLAASGLRPGDRVAAWLSSRVEIAAFLLACSRSGFVFCPSFHRNHTVDEVAELLQRMHARAFVAEEGFGADSNTRDIFAVTQAFDHLKRVYRLPAPAPRTASSIWDRLLLRKTPGAVESGRADDVVYLAFTSGTTGEPKGVMHSNNTLLANARVLATDWEFGPHSVIYTLSPLSHNLGFGGLVLTLLCGGEIVLHDLIRGASLLQRLRATSTTFIFGVPAHAMDLLDEIERSNSADLQTLKGFRISGGAIPPFVVEKLLARGIRPQSGYGMTEACSHHYTLPGDGPELIVGTSGRACPGYEIRLFSLDDPDQQAAAGEVGHIGGRGASLMLGYYSDQRATESSFNRDGWFMTGDLGLLDEKGYLQISGRLKDIIIRGGHNIHPAKIEMLATRYPPIQNAAAIPVKDARLGEKVCIVVVPRDGNVVDPQELLSHMHRAGLSKYDMPEYFLQVDQMPSGPSGKILKRALLPLIAEGKLTPQPVRWRG
jgi:acyl-CoA synthetase (AMP-forming)/AMP-acid ligase II